MVTVVVLGLFILLMLLRVPVAVSMLMVSVLVLLWLGEVPLVALPQYAISGVSSFELLAVPFFILAGEIMNTGGLTTRIFRLALVFSGWMPGGLAQVNIVGSVIFSGISGTAVADASGLGRVEIKAMREAGYDVGFSAGLTLASCIVGPLIPPSVVMILYALVAEVSVGRMLLAGVGPGLLLAAVLMAWVYWMVKTGRTPSPKVEIPRGRELFRVLYEGLPALAGPFIIMFGIVGGVFTPTEAGVAACVYSLIVSWVFYRELTWRMMGEMLIRSTLSSAMIMLIIGAATVMAWIITREQSAVQIAQWMTSLTDRVWLQLILINIFLLIVGCLIEGVPALLILTPVLLPVATNLGIDPVHFGSIMVFNLLIGIITPPMGIGLFIMANITGWRVERIARASMPFLIPLIATLLLITFIPAITLWIPQVLMK